MPTDEAVQLFATDGMTPEQIVQANRAGHFAEWLAGGSAPAGYVHRNPFAVAQLARDDLKSMTSDEIADARRAGKFARILGGAGA